MVNAWKRNISPLPAGRNGKSTNRSTQQHHHVNEVKSGWDSERFRALGAMRGFRRKRSLRRTNHEKHTSEAMKPKRNALRIMLREKLVGQESKLKMQMQRFSKSRTIWRMLKLRN